MPACVRMCVGDRLEGLEDAAVFAGQDRHVQHDVAWGFMRAAPRERWCGGLVWGWMKRLRRCRTGVAKRPAVGEMIEGLILVWHLDGTKGQARL
jgi:hypothetical protein